MRRIVAQVRKELTQIVRDWRTLALALVLPVVMLLLMSAALSLTVSDLPIVVQDFDGSSASNNFIDAFRASISFHVVAWPVDKSAEEALASNTARAVLIIPPHFGRDLARGVQTPVQFMLDASDANTAKLVAGDASLIAAAYNRQLASGSQAAPVQAAIRLWFNPGLSSKKFYGPGVFVLAISMFPPLLAALAMAKETEQKTILQVYVSSISAHEFLLGKILAFMAVALGEAVVMSAFLFTYFGLSFAGDPTPVIIATILYTFCVASFGTMIGAAIPNQTAALQAVALGGFLLVFLLSGLMFPIQNIPIALRWISNFVWGRYYIEIVRDALLQGGGWPAVWYKVIIIGVIGDHLLLACVARHEAHAGEGIAHERLPQSPLQLPHASPWSRKEFNQIRRDRRLQLSLVLPPVLQLTLFGFALSANVSDVRLAVVDDSHTPESRELISTLTESKSFRLAGTYPSVGQLGDAVSRGDADAGVVVPYDYARDLARQRPTTVQFLLNATNANTATIARAYAEGVLQSYNSGLRQQGIRLQVQPVAAESLARHGMVELQPAFLFNPGLVDSWFIVTGSSRPASYSEQLHRLVRGHGARARGRHHRTAPHVSRQHHRDHHRQDRAALFSALPDDARGVLRRPIRLRSSIPRQLSDAARRGMPVHPLRHQHRNRHCHLQPLGATGATDQLLRQPAALRVVRRAQSRRGDAKVAATSHRVEPCPPLRSHRPRKHAQGKRLYGPLAKLPRPAPLHRRSGLDQHHALPQAT